MWLVPHFLALDVAGAATQLFQRQRRSIYQAQSNPVFDRDARGRLRFGTARSSTRARRRAALVRAIRAGHAFFNLPTWTSACATPPSCPSSACRRPRCWRRRAWRALNMVVQPVVAEMLPGGQGWRVRFMPPWTDWPSDDPVADAAR
jgi:KDO2-lipid IV(A) lauroyltransferase